MTLNLWGVHRWEERRPAEQTGKTTVFGAASTAADGDFGNAVLSRLPILGSRSRRLFDASGATTVPSLRGN
jgi:endonuclease/exonuclease/phosphatase family metal-dependent hydrolase